MAFPWRKPLVDRSLNICQTEFIRDKVHSLRIRRDDEKRDNRPVDYLFKLAARHRLPGDPIHCPAPKTVKIGAIYPLSGESASTGEDIKAALELATQIINQSVDLPIPLAQDKGLTTHGGVTIDVIYQDSENNESIAAKQVERLIQKDHVLSLMGCYNSVVTAAASEQAEILKTPFLNTGSTAPILTQRGLDWFFRTTPDDSIFAQNFLLFFQI